MTPSDYDVAIVGGGLAGATLARSLAGSGMRTLVVERAHAFKDRVRGEGLLPWGRVEAAKLGIEPLLKRAGAIDVRYWKRYLGGAPRDCRDLVATTPGRHGCLDFYHPDMQRALLDAAESAGAHVRRGVEVTAIEPGAPPYIRIHTAHGDERVKARLVVGADGRSSKVRGAAGFTVRRDEHALMIAGVLHEGVQLPDDTVQYVQKPSEARAALVFPLGQGRFRSYFVYSSANAPRTMSGNGHAGDFVTSCIEAGAPPEWFEAAEAIGPLAAYPGADAWVEHPYREGVVLIGDAAAASNPAWGCGLALTLRDARVLRDRLLASDDWDAAAHAYAAEHDAYYGALHRLHGWLTLLMYETGPAADARRARAFVRLATDPSRAVDLQGLGPESPSDDATRQRFFGEDAD
ncbi:MULTISPECIES: NAD(P)/FAD-dependent oxidoreductase [unclassified Caballeronia]|uniref:FAD-dependent oxidoreductase n=1 Tax=unclassified Caballeronia TaxID=2646786 RepID=UPI00285C5772|nr:MULTISPECIES: NAD(P)/FAD-dependent oxidoreductase [unclassified Caballeronia]MDR5753598.1 NAD(P)/FAD-dependent oxidoreductase [Caballeronia sp. LZ024]MDR5839977.1 NAD(P)/FAD-dependent oxidoreductase [Caballeronia sp. LZ031]